MLRSNAKRNGKVADPVQEGSILKRALKAGSTWDDKVSLTINVDYIL